MADSVISDEMRRIVGVEGAESVAEVTTTGCRLFARAVGHTDLIFYDDAAARARGYRAIVAPPGYLGTAVYRPREPGEGERPSARARADIPYQRILDGSIAYEYFEPVLSGDVITSRSKVTGYQERQGSIGPMLITFRETTFTRQDGAVVAKAYGNIINY